MKKVALHNLGCKVNAYEMEAMQQLLEKHGYEIVPFAGRSGCLHYQYLYRDEYCGPEIRTDAAQSKKMNPDAIVVACGCYVQAKKELISRKVLILSSEIIRSRILLKSWKIMTKKRMRMVSGKPSNAGKGKELSGDSGYQSRKSV